MTPETVRAWIRQYLCESAGAKFDGQDVSDDADLLSLGIIDSLGFVGLIAALEGYFDVTLDLVNLPADQLVQIDGLARLVTQYLG
jgi:acyl carrier protein